MFLLIFSFVELLVDDIFQRLIEGIYIYMLIGWFSYALFCLSIPAQLCYHVHTQRHAVV